MIPTDQIYVTKPEPLSLSIDPRFKAPVPSKREVLALQEHMLTMPKTVVTIEHFIHAGMYSRTAFIPANVFGVGVEWAEDYIAVVVGDITVTTDDEVIRLRGHNILKAKAGLKRVILAHADTYFTAIFKTSMNTECDAETELSRECDFLQTRMG